jgi:hypothetical protein
MSELPLHSENLTSVAIDGSRISVFTAIAIVQMDPELDLPKRMELLQLLGAAGEALDLARESLPVIITSVHIVRPGEL